MTKIRSIAAQLPTAEEGLRWYAFRTMFKREKLVGKRLKSRGLESYVPLKKEVRRYKSKTVTVELPLFSSYVFVRLSAKRYAEVLGDPDVFEIVHFKGEVGRVTDEEIDLLRRILRDPADGFDPEPFAGLVPGTPVIISGGTLAGTKGLVIEQQGNRNFVVELRTLGISLSMVVARELLTAEPMAAMVRRAHDAHTTKVAINEADIA